DGYVTQVTAVGPISLEYVNAQDDPRSACAVSWHYAEPARLGATVIITSIKAFPLRIPFKPGARPAPGAWGPCGLTAADSLLVKVTTDDGLEGWGEAFGFNGVPVTQRGIAEG